MSGSQIAAKVAQRANDDPRKGAITFEIVSKGKSRRRTAAMVRTETGATHRLLLAFDKPSSIKGTTFLSYDHKAAQKTDETWLFLPATERTRRVPASDRSDSFMGTELSFGDVKDSFKFGLADYTFSSGGKSANGSLILKGKAKSDAIARQIGYGSFTAEIDPKTWFPRVINFNDPAGRKLKTIVVRDVKRVGDSWTATDFRVSNHRTGRATLVTVAGLSAASGVSNSLFDPSRLDRAAGRMP
ncbi:MAG: outer membrane lipoprotein-sorting protein [Pseudomonadota bacterium]